ncbi:Non-functional nadph-dependent codeinone reductase [Thalictrum thalictroides]|uniref:Non-functional nadph-dependent codeinone reductase n=1 Tax=Thalictrum thalictroides TaxID=46969 RepID=A0A7J6URV8_THATH|nr:Non-functional nadph-dependent codeinone reductase [Thalictrum thalictroides]
MGNVPEVILSSGHQMPLVGMGTASIPFAGSELVKSAVLDAIKLGYKHFDTAALYGSEKPLGEAIAEAIQQGLIRSRGELFITSKLWCNDGYQDRVLPALQKTLQNLQLDYIDLYLIHWPLSITPGEIRFPELDEKVLPIDYKSVWQAMEECQKLGLTKSIGVSNFTCKKLEFLLASARIPPAVNQVEMNPLWRQERMIEFCKDKGILVIAYSPLGQGNSNVMECELLKEIAKARGITLAQVCIRWVYEQGVGVLVKSFNEVRLKENLDIFDWALSEEESTKINRLPESKGYPGHGFIRVDGPFKSLQELWDGEI